MKRPFSLYTGALVALLFAGAWARADFIEWSFNWTPVGPTVLESDTSPDSKIIISNESPGTAAGHALGGVHRRLVEVERAERGGPGAIPRRPAAGWARFGRCLGLFKHPTPHSSARRSDRHGSPSRAAAAPRPIAFVAVSIGVRSMSCRERHERDRYL